MRGPLDVVCLPTPRRDHQARAARRRCAQQAARCPHGPRPSVCSRKHVDYHAVNSTLRFSSNSHAGQVLPCQAALGLRPPQKGPAGRGPRRQGRPQAWTPQTQPPRRPQPRGRCPARAQTVRARACHRPHPAHQIRPRHRQAVLDPSLHPLPRPAPHLRHALPVSRRPGLAGVELQQRPSQGFLPRAAQHGHAAGRRESRRQECPVVLHCPAPVCKFFRSGPPAR